MKKTATLTLLLCTLSGVSRGEDYNEFNGHVGAWSNQFISDVGDVDGNKYNFNLNFDYRRHRSKEWETRLTLKALHNDLNKTLWSLNEAYVTYHFAASNYSALQVGRAILDWSDLDSQWGLGKINNRQNFNFFEPGQEGLIGVVLKKRFNNGIRFQAFATPLYFPELNPGYDIDKDKGELNPTSPWSKPLPSRAEFQGVERDVFYKVDQPPEDKVIWKGAGGLNLGYNSDHWDLGGYYLRKPENQISTSQKVIPRDGTLNIIDLYVKPEFYYHDIYGGNLRWFNKGVSVYGSAIAIRPNDFPVGNEIATAITNFASEKRREDYVGFGISQALEKTIYGFDYVWRASPFNIEDDLNVEHPRWSQAVHLWGRYHISSSFEASGDLKYDILTRDRLAMLKLGYYPVEYLLLNLGVNMIGAPSDDETFWTDYADNDAVYAEMRYIF